MALAAVLMLGLAGCVTDGSATGGFSSRGGATFAFESIDGPPPDVFHSFVQALSVEAETQQVAVVSREAAPGYRVRGYLSAQVSKTQTVVAWAWDVYDREGQRVRRVTGEESAGAPGKNAWNAANSAVLQRIAKASMTQLSGLTDGPPQPAQNAAPAASPEQTLALARAE